MYFLVFFLTMIILFRRKRKVGEVESLKIKKCGLTFVSYYRHFISVPNTKFFTINNQVFLKRGDDRLVIKNVSNVEYVEGKLYFKCLGKVEMLFDNKYFRYFNVLIFFDKYDLSELKYKASIDMLYNPFDFENRKNFKFYIKVVKDILQLHFNDKKLVVKSNKYLLGFKLIYKLNGKMRRVCFNFK